VTVRTVAVCGGGHGALAAAGDLAQRGFDVRLALRNRERFAPLFASGRIRLEGALEGVVELASVTDDHAAAVRGADFVLVPLPADAQVEMARRIAPAVDDGQVVYLTKGTFGATLVRRELGGRAVVAENPILPYGTRLTGGDSVRIGLLAEHLPTGVYPASAADDALREIAEVYPVTERAEDVLDASLLNFDPALHAPLVLMNAGAIEKLPDFDIHTQGNPPSVVNVSIALDEERIALRRALGYSQPDWPLADLYSRRGETFFGVLSEERMAKQSVWREKIDFRHRYVEEDIGCGLALWASLGRRLGVPTPLADAMLRLASIVNGVDYARDGRTLERLGLAELSIDELKRRLHDGDA
jgi:opine dehydrogenase